MLNHLKVLFVAAFAFALVGCFKADIAIDVNNDESGQVQTVIAYDAEQLGALASLGGEADLDLEDFCSEILTELEGESSDDVSIEEYREGNFCGATITVDVAAGDDFATALSNSLEGNDELGAGSAGLDITKVDDDEWTLEVDLGDGIGAALGDSPELAQAQAFLGSGDGISIGWSVSLPGDADEHNADEVTVEEGKTTFTWNLGLDSQLTELRASTVPGSSAGGLLWILLGLLALAVVAAAVFFLMRSRNSNDSAPTYVAPDAASQHEFQAHAPAAAPVVEDFSNSSVAAETAEEALAEAAELADPGIEGLGADGVSPTDPEQS